MTAAAGGFDESVARESALDSGPLGDPPLSQTFSPGVGGPILGSPLGPVPINASQGSVMIPVFGMGPAFGSATMDVFGGELSGRFENFLQGASGFGNEIFGFLDENPSSLSDTESFEEIIFDDPSLYDDYRKQDFDQSTEISSSTNNKYF